MSELPSGCVRGPILGLTSRGVVVSHPSAEDERVPVIWVDFPPNSTRNPFFFSAKKKVLIMTVALFFGNITAYQTSAYSIGFTSMKRDLGATDLQAAAGVSLYGWGFALGPLALAPLTEEFGRYWMYIGSIGTYMLCHLTQSLAHNIGTVLVGRFLLGICGCIGATVVSGTVSDIFPPQKRGFPMSLFTLSVVAGPGLGAATMCWVEDNPHLEWRWIAWIQMIALAVYWPIAYFVLRETRAPVILRRIAKKLRKERGMQDGGRYTARSEVDKPALGPALKQSMSRPILFVTMEPIVTFFALWAALVWGVFFIQIAGLPYVFRTIYGFGITASGSTYWCIVIGGVIGWVFNFYQDALYRRNVGRVGVEARLYAPMAAGIVFAIGCIIFGLTSIPSVHWIGPCIGIVIVLAAAFTIYQTCFVYLSECYGSHASSAVAGMSCLRIIVGSAFAMFTNDMFENLTPRWGLLLMGCIAILLAPIPFIAYYKGPWIRARSPYSKILMAEERKRIEAEMMQGTDSEDLESRMEQMEGESLMGDEIRRERTREALSRHASARTAVGVNGHSHSSGSHKVKEDEATAAGPRYT
ncbi:hypothetical protein I316_03126 [Kwoniella heveanensis BCC8398]|uniref:Major facilitator superfamily (MFS) profile domain-containing protein n=1 Tax=Kwoniella heveanensis BCC8398 TaxID=1296120 RepID=A0A1B9GVP3_9TREE|nr:hypothetical protein I316_03126 [Kwoniella heveanensis BCC8398]